MVNDKVSRLATSVDKQRARHYIKAGLPDNFWEKSQTMSKK